MATTRSFSTMLKDYMPYELLSTEMLKRDWFLQNVEIDSDWMGGPMQIPFIGARATSHSFGSLTAENDISEEQFVRAELSGYKELWGTMIWNHRDLDEHLKSEQSFIKDLLGRTERFIDGMREVASLSFLQGPFYDKATVDGTALGVITVNRPERFELGQKVYVDDDNSAPVVGYVRSININTKELVIYDARTGGAVVDLSGYTVAQNAKLYLDGSQTAANQFTSLRSLLLSAANGGDTNAYGVPKTSYPHLQAVNISGASISATNILDKIFDAFTTTRERGKGNPSKVVMSYKHLGSVMKAIEGSKGAFKQADSTKASIYGWTEIEIVGVKGALTVVGVHEMPDDIIYLLDMRGIKLHTNKMFEMRKNPDGLLYYEVRNTTGFYYIADIRFYGELVVSHLSAQGILYSISY